MKLSSTRLDLRKAKILLVDDNAQSLELLVQIMVGFQATRAKTCSSAEECRKVIVAEPFDLIIIDAEMPNEDGISLTRHVRSDADQPNFVTPIILVSSFTPVEKIVRCRDAGGNMVVKKPIAPAVLLSRIEWLARNTREFVVTANYSGPDRRFKNHPLPDGVEERRAGAIALIASSDRAMSQDDVDSLFG
jgi:DNA-binding response OmpR family regulator